MTPDVNHDNVIKMLEEVPERVKTALAQVIDMHSKIKWKTCRFTIPNKPKPSQRPRLCGHRVYVPGAAKNAAFFNKRVYPTLRDVFITSPCKMQIDIFVETPASFTKTQKLLAEMKILNPWSATGDVDNYIKSSMDQIQPNKKRHHHGILMDDCLVTGVVSDKYYSITPRYEIRIDYMVDIPEELIHILRLDKINKTSNDDV